MERLQTIYELLIEYRKEEIDYVIQMLTYEEKKIIKLRYGLDLNNPDGSNWKREYNCKFYRSILSKLRNNLEILTKDKTIYDRFIEYPKEEVNQALKFLTIKENEVLLSRYGINLNKPDNSNWKLKYRDNFHMLILKLNKLLKYIEEQKKIINQRKIKTIYEILYEYKKEKIDLVLKCLNENNKSLLYLMFGFDLNNPILCNNQIVIKNFTNLLLPRIRNILEGMEDITKEITVSPNVLNASFSIIDQLYNQEYQYLVYVYSFKEVIVALLIKKLETRYDYSFKDIVELFDINIEELKKIKEEIVPLLDNEKRKLK